MNKSAIVQPSCWGSFLPLQQCSGSIKFWDGSGSANPWLWLMDPDPDPAIFVIDLQDASKKIVLTQFFLLNTFRRYIYTKIKSQKESQKVGIKVFLTNFCMMIEGSGSVHMIIGSGSGRPKNMWTRWIRIRNTALQQGFYLHQWWGRVCPEWECWTSRWAGRRELARPRLLGCTRRWR